MSRVIAAATAVYAALVHLYPPAFHREFAESMVEDFAEASRETVAGRGRSALLVHWLLALLDLVWTIPQQWIRQPAFWIALPAAGAALASLQAIAWLGSLIRSVEMRVEPAREPDAVLALILATSLFPVVAVILFAWWFVIPLRHRARRLRRRRA